MRAVVLAVRAHWLWLAAGALALLAVVRVGPHALPRNWAAADAARTLTGSQVRAGLDAADGLGAYALGLRAREAGDQAEAERLWAQTLRAGARFLPLVHAQAPSSLGLAQLAAAMYPNAYQAWEWLGDASPAGPEALRAYQRAAELEPHANLVWEKVAEQARELGEMPISSGAARRACELNPIRNGSCHHAARLAYLDSDWEAVIHYFEMGDDPEHPEDWVRLIRAARRLGQKALAEAYLVQAQAEDPADYTAMLELNP